MRSKFTEVRKVAERGDARRRKMTNERIEIHIARLILPMGKERLFGLPGVTNSGGSKEGLNWGSRAVILAPLRRLFSSFRETFCRNGLNDFSLKRNRIPPAIPAMVQTPCAPAALDEGFFW